MVVGELLAKARALQARVHVVVIVLVDVSTTTSPGTTSPSTLNRALTHIEVGNVLRRRMDSRSLAGYFPRTTTGGGVSALGRALPPLPGSSA